MNWPGYPVRNPAASPPRTPDPFFPRNLHCFAPYGCFSYISDITLNAKQSYNKFGYEVKSHQPNLAEKFFMDTIGTRLKAFADSQFGSVSAMERRLGLAKHLLHKYARDESKPGAELLQKFRLLGMSICLRLAGYPHLGKRAVERLRRGGCKP